MAPKPRSGIRYSRRTAPLPAHAAPRSQPPDKLVKDTDTSPALTLALDYQPPLAWSALTTFLAQRSAPCLLQVDGHTLCATVAYGQQRGWFTATPNTARDRIEVTAAPNLADTLAWLRRDLRRLFDLDAQPAHINSHLRVHARLSPLVDRAPGLRIPGTLSGFELALRAILGQQISVKAASTIFTRFAHYFGATVTTPFDGLERVAPRADVLANASLQAIIDRGLPSRRAQSVQTLAQSVATGELLLEPPVDTAQTATLQALPGIGPWTTQYIRMRALGDTDAFPDSDLGLLRAVDTDSPRQLRHMAQPWRPWRAYAAMHLWHHSHAGGG